MNETENKFSNYCKKNKYYCQRLQTHTVTGKGTEQISDFLVANFKDAFFVEIKQRKGNLFNTEDLTQKRKMELAMKKTDKIKSLILINYYERNKTFLFSIDDYIQICKINTFKNGKLRKSLNYKDIPFQFEFNWKMPL